MLWDDAEKGQSDTKLEPDDKIRRVVMCSGKVYYDLLEERDARGIDDVYLLRVEQFYPFPALSLVKELERFKKADMVWCQEEPKNQGAWTFIEPNIEWVLTRIGAKHKRPIYVGRAASASPATGLASQHKAQQAALVNDALTIEGLTDMSTEVRVPTLGESVTEATVATWFKKPGDRVAVDEMLCELETDKVTVEVPSPAAGTLGEIVADEGETVGVDALLATIAEEGQAGATRSVRARAATPGRAATAGRSAPSPSAPPPRKPRSETKRSGGGGEGSEGSGGGSVDVMVPTLGESVTEATVATWFKKAGDRSRPTRCSASSRPTRSRSRCPPRRRHADEDPGRRGHRRSRPAASSP